MNSCELSKTSSRWHWQRRSRLQQSTVRYRANNPSFGRRRHDDDCHFLLVFVFVDAVIIHPPCLTLPGHVSVVTALRCISTLVAILHLS
jgi:hypothetical protein